MVKKKKFILNFKNEDIYEEHLKLVFEHNISLKDRKIFIIGEVTEQTFKDVTKGMTELEALSHEKITVEISSEGGSVYDALAIIGRLRSSPCVIETKAFGHVMSCATLILACGDMRYISEYAYFMYHESSYDLEGSHRQNKHRIQQAEREEQDWARWMSIFSDKPKTYWMSIAEKGLDLYLNAEEVLKTGAVDGIIENQNSERKTRK